MAREKFTPAPGGRNMMHEVSGTDGLPDETIVSLTDKDLEGIVILDDTPEADKGKPDSLDYSVADDEDPLTASKDVRKRIDRLKYETHTERRAKESAERELANAVQIYQQQQTELTQLRALSRENATTLSDTILKRNDSAMETAKKKFQMAHEEGDSAAIAEATAEISELTAESANIRARVAVTPKREPVAPTPAPAPVAQQPANQLAPNVVSWISRNRDWWQRPGHEAKTNKALSIHHDMVARGVSPYSDEYTHTLDRGLKEVYPEHQASSPAYAEDVQAGENNPKRTNVVTKGSREEPGRGSRTVVLTRSQVALAKKLGIPQVEYAKEILKRKARPQGVGA